MASYLDMCVADGAVEVLTLATGSVNIAIASVTATNSGVYSTGSTQAGNVWLSEQLSSTLVIPFNTSSIYNVKYPNLSSTWVPRIDKPWAIEWWMNAHSGAMGQVGGNEEWIWAMAELDGLRGLHLRYNTDNAYGYLLSLRNGGGYIDFGPTGKATAFQDKIWHHFVVNFIGYPTSATTVYPSDFSWIVDGILYSSTAPYGVVGTNGDCRPSAAFCAGTPYDSGTGAYYVTGTQFRGLQLQNFAFYYNTMSLQTAQSHSFFVADWIKSGTMPPSIGQYVTKSAYLDMCIADGASEIYPLRDGTGTKAIAYVTATNSGTYTSSSWATGTVYIEDQHIQKTFIMTNPSSSMIAPNLHTAFNPECTQSFAIEWWMRNLSRSIDVTNGAEQYVWTKSYNVAPPPYRGMHFRYSTTLGWIFRVANNGDYPSPFYLVDCQPAGKQTALNDGFWHHVVVNYTAVATIGTAITPSNITWIIDGVTGSSVSAGYGGTSIGTIRNTASLQIGNGDLLAAVPGLPGIQVEAMAFYPNATMSLATALSHYNYISDWLITGSSSGGSGTIPVLLTASMSGAYATMSFSSAVTASVTYVSGGVLDVVQLTTSSIALHISQSYGGSGSIVYQSILVPQGANNFRSSKVEKLTKFHTKDETTNRIQDQTLRVLNPVISNPLISGRLATNIPLHSGSNLVDHGLDRAPLGWIVVGLHPVSSSITDQQATNAIPHLTLALSSSANCTASLYIF